MKNADAIKTRHIYFQDEIRALIGFLPSAIVVNSSESAN